MAEGAAVAQEKSMANSTSLGLLPRIPLLREKTERRTASDFSSVFGLDNVCRVIPGVGC